MNQFLEPNDIRGFLKGIDLKRTAEVKDENNLLEILNKIVTAVDPTNKKENVELRNTLAKEIFKLNNHKLYILVTLYSIARLDEEWIVSRAPKLDYLLDTLNKKIIITDFFCDAEDFDIKDNKQKTYLSDFQQGLKLQILNENWWLDLPLLYLLLKPFKIILIIVNNYCATQAILNCPADLSELSGDKWHFAMAVCTKQQSSCAYSLATLNGGYVMKINETDQDQFVEFIKHHQKFMKRNIDSVHVEKSTVRASQKFLLNTMEQEALDTREASVEVIDKKIITPVAKKTSVKLIVKENVPTVKTPKKTEIESSESVINPKTGRKVAVGSKTYLQLQKDGVI